MSEKKEKAINKLDEALVERIIKDVQKQFGQRALQRLTENDGGKFQVETIPSGSILLDEILGVGGYPRGRITEIYGPESSGKTTLGLHAIVEAQKRQGLTAFLDIEHALDAKYAKNLGVDLKNLLVSQPENGEQAFDILESLLETKIFDLIILDSVAALTPKAELEGDMSDQGIGLQARLMSKGLRKINSLVSSGKTALIFINQLREKVGVIFGNPETTPGGRALRFYATIRLEVRRGEAITNNGVVVANRIKIKVIKNKVAAPSKIAVLTINYNQGLDFKTEVFDLALAHNFLTKNGVWYSQNETRLGQGKQAVFEWWNNHPREYEKLVQDITNLNNLQG